MAPRKKSIPIEKLTGNQQQLVKGLLTLTELYDRLSLSYRLGKSYKGDRDLYEALGWKKNPVFEDYVNMFKRHPMGRAAINRPVSDCWSQFPDVYDNDDQETEFDVGVKALVKDHQLNRMFKKADRLSTLGQYSILLLGFDDAKDASIMAQPVTRASKLLYVQRYSQSTAQIAEWEQNPGSPRFGQPKRYTIFYTAGVTSAASLSVDWSRVIHICEDGLENDVLSMPRLEAVFNALRSLELVAGGSAEMFWRGAFYGMALKKDPNVTIRDEAKLVDEIENYVHSLSRYMNLEGIDVQQLSPQVADPMNHVEVQINMIAAGENIPKRILMGSERGELASSQDERNWRVQMSERREMFCTPVIIVPFFERCVQVGVLAQPRKEMVVEWPDLLAPTDKEKAEVGKIRADAVAGYANSIGAADILPVKSFYQIGLGLDDSQIEMIGQEVEAQASEANGQPGEEKLPLEPVPEIPE